MYAYSFYTLPPVIELAVGSRRYALEQYVGRDEGSVPGDLFIQRVAQLPDHGSRGDARRWVRAGLPGNLRYRVFLVFAGVCNPSGTHVLTLHHTNPNWVRLFWAPLCFDFPGAARVVRRLT